jgi:hypothetical protein
MPIRNVMTAASPGTEGAGDPRVPGIPVFKSNGTGSITIEFAGNGNDSVVKYAIEAATCTVGSGISYTPIGWVAANGTITTGAAVYRKLSEWGTPVVTGLADFTGYAFRAKACNEATTPVLSDFSEYSRVMNPLPSLSYSPAEGEGNDRRVALGNTVIDLGRGVTLGGNVVVEATRVKYYGTVLCELFLKNRTSETSRLEVSFSLDNGATYTALEPVNGISTSPEGTRYTYAFDSYTHCGRTTARDQVRVKFMPKDAAGVADAAVETAAFAVKNWPEGFVWENGDARDYGTDNKPFWTAVIPSFASGTRGFPRIRIYYNEGSKAGQLPERERRSVEDVRGFSYQDVNGVYVPLTPAGIPSTIPDGVRRMKFQLENGEELVAGDKLVTGAMEEV